MRKDGVQTPDRNLLGEHWGPTRGFSLGDRHDEKCLPGGDEWGDSGGPARAERPWGRGRDRQNVVVGRALVRRWDGSPAALLTSCVTLSQLLNNPGPKSSHLGMGMTRIPFIGLWWRQSEVRQVQYLGRLRGSVG